MVYINVIFLIIALVYVFWIFGLIWAFRLDAPYVPIRKDILDKLLRAVNPRPGDLWIDLGSGDGRILIEAVKRYGVRGIGIERVTPIRWFSRYKIARAGLRDKIQIQSGDFFKTDLSEADMVSFYLLPETNARLYEKLKKEMRSGAKLVYHRFKIENALLIYEDAKHKIYVSEIT